MTKTFSDTKDTTSPSDLILKIINKEIVGTTKYWELRIQSSVDNSILKGNKN